jgi:sulfur-oxidizing protein SoxY
MLPDPVTIVSRRTFGVGRIGLVAFPAAAVDLRDDGAATVRAMVAGGVPQEGGVLLRVPDVAENGAQVPVTTLSD